MRFLLLALIIAPTFAFADEVEFHCSGDYTSKSAYNPNDPSTVSVHAELDVTMLGDENPKGYSVTEGQLVMKATNDHDADAGNFAVKDTWAKPYKAHNPRYKDHVKLDMGSKKAAAYPDDGDQPDTFVLLPWGDNGAEGNAYVQRQNSGHDVYPTITLKCD